VPGVAAGKAIVAQQQVVPVVEVAAAPGVAAGRVVVNVKQVGWMPVASGPVHSVCSMEYDLN
jgi:hypothetical protein